MRTSGVVHVSSDAIANSSNKGYCFILANKEYTISQNGDQIDLYKEKEFVCSFYVGNTRVNDFNNLPSLTKLQVKGFGFNAAGTGALTDSVDVLVQ